MKIAAIQATPVYLNPEKTAEKALGLMAEVAKEGAELCAFSEVFMAGYPIWLPAQASSMDESLRSTIVARKPLPFWTGKSASYSIAPKNAADFHKYSTQGGVSYESNSDP